MTSAVSIIEDYALAALKQAVFERLEDGTIAAILPDCAGIIAFGATPQACVSELLSRIEDWATAWLDEGQPLPVYENIDLNLERHRRLAAYHYRPPAQPSGEIYDSEEALDAAFARHRTTR
ncbi:MAG: type II toxin-antitoxin system HicB family antitoxin [Dehalococcoidia bacterium]